MSVWKWPDTQITRVIDGDTVDLGVARDLAIGGPIVRDLGFQGQITIEVSGVARYPVRVRLNRINAPRIATPAGKAARSRVVQLLDPTRTFYVETVKNYKFGGPEDRTGEYMAEIRLPDGRLISDVLMAEGLATYWDGTGKRPNDE